MIWREFQNQKVTSKHCSSIMVSCLREVPLDRELFVSLEDCQASRETMSSIFCDPEKFPFFSVSKLPKYRNNLKPWKILGFDFEILASELSFGDILGSVFSVSRCRLIGGFFAEDWGEPMFSESSEGHTLGLGGFQENPSGSLEFYHILTIVWQ